MTTQEKAQDTVLRKMEQEARFTLAVLDLRTKVHDVVCMGLHLGYEPPGGWEDIEACADDLVTMLAKKGGV